MKRFRILTLTLLATLCTASLASSARDVSYSKRYLHRTVVHVVTANMRSSNVRVTPAIARRGIGHSEGFGSMLSRLRPAAAVTGTFFCTQKLIPTGHIVIDGALINEGSVGAAVCFAPDGRIDFITGRAIATTEWTSYDCVLRTGPLLVYGGLAYVDGKSEGFSQRSLYRPARRAALGVTKSGKLLLVGVNKPIQLGRLAAIMRELGAWNAVNLDGGSSTALAFRGSIFAHPARRLTNLLLIYDSQAAFQHAKANLYPRPVTASTGQSKG